eukprot:6780171-Prymnesium_polylepis.2
MDPARQDVQELWHFIDGFLELIPWTADGFLEPGELPGRLARRMSWKGLIHFINRAQIAVQMKSTPTSTIGNNACSSMRSENDPKHYRNGHSGQVSLRCEAAGKLEVCLLSLRQRTPTNAEEPAPLAHLRRVDVVPINDNPSECIKPTLQVICDVNVEHGGDDRPNLYEAQRDFDLRDDIEAVKIGAHLLYPACDAMKGARVFCNAKGVA